MATREDRAWKDQSLSVETGTATLEPAQHNLDDRTLCQVEGCEVCQAAYAHDIKALYREVLASPEYANSLGKIHDLFLDFLTFHIAEVERYSPLPDLMPEKDKEGNYAERWLYFPTLDGPFSSIEVQDGPIGPISKMFRENPWHGVVIRICGNGKNKCGMLPRGFLKSELGTKTFTLWNIIRDKTLRTMVRSVTSDLSKKFVGWIKNHFDANDKFRRLWGSLRPFKREGVWASEELQVNVPVHERRGTDYTVQAKGMESEIVGGHFDRVILDDIVAETNSKGQALEDTITKAINMFQAEDPTTETLDLGTRWEENDVHKLFIDADSEMAQDCSFMVATILDANPNGVCHEGIVGRGNPMWPEKIDEKAIKLRRRKTPVQRVWYGQQFNQYIGTTLRVFDRSWIKNFPETYGELYPDCDERRKFEPLAHLPSGLARQLRLNIFMAVDTATGKNHTNDRMDYTACVILGQTEDRKRFFVLDGFKERLPPHAIPEAIVKKALYWRRIADDSNARFGCGFEETGFTNFLQPLLEMHQRRLGSNSIFPITLLKHNQAAKLDRIRVLARPYSENNNGPCIFWPQGLVVQPFGKGEPYDLIGELEDEFVKYPSVAHDDLLDAHAYAFEMSGAADYDDPPESNPDWRPRPAEKGVAGAYSRVLTAEEEENEEEDLGGTSEEWTM